MIPCPACTVLVGQSRLQNHPADTFRHVFRSNSTRAAAIVASSSSQLIAVICSTPFLTNLEILTTSQNWVDRDQLMYLCVNTHVAAILGVRIYEKLTGRGTLHQHEEEFCKRFNTRAAHRSACCLNAVHMNLSRSSLISLCSFP
jgi:hypothetical protein